MCTFSTMQCYMPMQKWLELYGGVLSTGRTNLGVCKIERRMHEIFYTMITFSIGDMMVREGYGVGCCIDCGSACATVSDLF